MKLTNIAIKNLKKNFSFYSLYLFSVAFVLMIFFCFVSFSMNKVIMERISSDGRVETMCRTISVFVMAFVVFYMSYSNKFFMKRRMKELGIYALLGYRKSTILRLLTIETVFICLGGLLIGIVTGGLLHQGVTIGITKLLKLTINLNEIPLFNNKSILFSLIFVIVVLFALFLSNWRLLHKNTLLNLVRIEKKIEKPIKVRGIVAILGLALLIIGYVLALDITRGKKSLWNTIGFSPIALLTMFLVVTGTIFFIYSFLPFAGLQIKKHKNKLYEEINIVAIPKFMHHIRSNAKSLILLVLICAGSLSIFGATILSVWYPTEALERIVPNPIEFRVQNKNQVTQALKIMDDTVGMNNYLSYKTSILKTTATSIKLPYEYNIGINKGRKPGFECISEKDYISLMKIQGKKIKWEHLKDNDCVLIKYRPDHKNSDIGNVYRLSIGNEQYREVTVRETSLKNPIGFANSVGTLIISDCLYKQMGSNGIEQIQVMSIGGKGICNNKIISEKFSQLLFKNPYFASVYQRKSEIIHLNSSTLLLICFVTVIFLIAIGSTLYFQNVSTVTYDKDDYEILKKMGYSSKKVKKIIRSQIQIYFAIPYGVGLMHSIFALLSYKYALVDDVLGRSSAVIIPILVSIIIFSIVYMIYYQITKHSCYRIALK